MYCIFRSKAIRLNASTPHRALDQTFVWPFARNLMFGANRRLKYPSVQEDISLRRPVIWSRPACMRTFLYWDPERTRDPRGHIRCILWSQQL